MLPGAVIIGLKREICSLYSWCKKLNQVEKLNTKAGRIWEDSLRGCGICLTAFSKRQVGCVRFRETLVPCLLHPQQLWLCCEPQTSAHLAWDLKQDAAVLRQTEMRGNVLCLCLWSCTAPIQMAVWKGFIKSPCLFAPAVVHIQGCHGDSVPVCWGLCLHLWFL